MKLNHSHFNISTNSNNHTSYQQWHEYKLNNAPNYLEDDLNCLFVEIDYAQSPSSKQCESILEACQKHSFGLYRINNLSPDDKQHIHSFASTLGLTTLDSNICADTDSLTSITRTKHKGQHEYIPYSDRRLSWHTDGYYNTPENTINSMLLHCAQPAKEGGESLLMDHEIAYLLLRDENPAYIQALMQDDAMTIPANILDGEIIRPAQTGPVFSVTRTGQLHMRYSARKRNIEWKQTPETLEAVSFLENLLDSDSPHILKHTLAAGEGLICRNILHRRTSFVDYDEPDKKRLLYRGRYYDCLQNV